MIRSRRRIWQLVQGFTNDTNRFSKLRLGDDEGGSKSDNVPMGRFGL